MDPNANVREMAQGNIGPARMRDLGEALCGWLDRGGFPPSGMTESEAWHLGDGARLCRSRAQVARYSWIAADFLRVSPEAR